MKKLTITLAACAVAILGAAEVVASKTTLTRTQKSEYAINPLIFNRWSARAMSGESLTDQELMPLFEAARWAPSSTNAQPWIYLCNKRYKRVLLLTLLCHLY